MASTLHPRGCHRAIVELRGVTLVSLVKNRPKLNFYDPGDKRGAIRIPTSVTVDGLNTRTCSFEYQPSRYQISTEFELLNTELIPERMNVLVLDRRRRLYFSKKSYNMF